MKAPGFAAALEEDAPAARFRVLLQDDAIGAERNGGASEDARRGPRRERFGGGSSGDGLADGELGRDDAGVAAEDGVAVHRGDSDRRRRAPRVNGGREHAPRRVLKGDRLCIERNEPRENAPRAPSSIGSNASAIFAARAAGLFEEAYLADLHGAVGGFGHVVDRQERDADRHQRFHFGAGTVARAYVRSRADGARRLVELEVDADEGEGKGCGTAG